MPSLCRSWRQSSSERPSAGKHSPFTGQAAESTSISGTVTAMRASPPSGRASAWLAAGSAGRTEAVGAWLGAMLPGRQSRALRQGLDRHAIVGLARALQRRHELARDRAGNLKPGFAVEDADRAHLMLGDMASAAEQRQEPARVGVVVAPDVDRKSTRLNSSH